MRQTFSTSYTPDGPVHNDNSDMLLEVFENTYFHLSGRTPAQEGFRVRILSTEDYWRVSDEEGATAMKAYAGWCCRSKPDSIHMFVNADNLLPSALGIVFHEVGHGLHDILRPEQWGEWYEAYEPPENIMIWRAYVEGVAIAFTVANFRALEEQTGVETSMLPYGAYFYEPAISAIVDSVRTLENSELYGAEAYYRGRLLIWTAMLYDPDLSHLRREFERNGRLSGASMYELFLKLVNLETVEIPAYMDSVTPDDLTAAELVIRNTIQTRIGRKGLEYPELGPRMFDTIILP